MSRRWVLEERTCRCGCQQTFRVLEGSPSYFASAHHDPQYVEFSFNYVHFKKRQLRDWLHEYDTKLRQLEEEEESE